MFVVCKTVLAPGVLMLTDAWRMSVRSNHIGADGVRALAEALQRNIALTILNLWWGVCWSL
jgi:hypothetical protein